MPNKAQYRLTMDFEDKDSIVGFLQDLGDGVLDVEFDAYPMDMLDVQRIARKNWWIVTGVGDGRSDGLLESTFV